MNNLLNVIKWFSFTYCCRILTIPSKHLFWQHFRKILNTAATTLSTPVVITRMKRSITILPAWLKSYRSGSRRGLVLSVSMFDTSLSDRVPTMIRPTLVNCTIQMYALLMVFIVIYVGKFPTKFSNIHLKTLSITSFLALDGLIKH